MSPSHIITISSNPNVYTNNYTTHTQEEPVQCKVYVAGVKTTLYWCENYTVRVIVMTDILVVETSHLRIINKMSDLIKTRSHLKLE